MAWNVGRKLVQQLKKKLDKTEKSHVASFAVFQLFKTKTDIKLLISNDMKQLSGNRFFSLIVQLQG